MSEQLPEAQYPSDFDPTRFTAPELYLRAQQTPGFIAFGAEMESREELQFESLCEEMAPLGINVAMLVLKRVDGDQSYFAVYLDGSADNSGVTREQFEKARMIVGNHEAFANFSPTEKAREVVKLARVLADGGDHATVLRVTAEGEQLITYPQEDAEET